MIHVFEGLIKCDENWIISSSISFIINIKVV